MLSQEQKKGTERGGDWSLVDMCQIPAKGRGKMAIEIISWTNNFTVT